jgi:hypothetical protein
MPAPGIGESPMRPGSFPLVPPVDTPAVRITSDRADRVRPGLPLLALAIVDEDGGVTHLDPVVAGEARSARPRDQYVPPVPEDFDCQVDWMPHVFQARDAAGPQLRALHHAGIELHLAVCIEGCADARVQKGLVLHVAHGGDGRGKRTISDPRPAQLQGSLDSGLPWRALGGRNRSRAAVDYERARSQACS